MEQNSALAHAILGLLHQKPLSGYDLRKIFAETPMGTFSDSPGAIYPALQRLEKRGLVRSRVAETSGLRRRRLYRPTAFGKRAFKAWQTRPIASEDIIYHVDELLLRFSFMEETAGSAEAVRFLKALARELASHIPTLRQYLKARRRHMGLSGRLALQSGIRSYESLLRWAKSSLATYMRSKKGAIRP